MTLSRAVNLRYSFLKARHAVAEVASTVSSNVTLSAALHTILEAYKSRMTTVMSFAGASMIPTLNPQGGSEPSAVERLLVRQIARPSTKNIFVGDVVAVQSPLSRSAAVQPQEVLVRRVAAVEGDEMVSDDPDVEAFELPKVLEPYSCV